MSLLDDVDEPSTTAGFGEAFNGVVEEDAPEDNSGEASAPLNWVHEVIREAGERLRRPDPRLVAHAVSRARAAYNETSGYWAPPMNIVLDVADAARVLAYRSLRVISDRLRDLSNWIEPTH